MSNKAQKQTISTISEFFFEIPPYQRLYEWKKEQIETLLEDVRKAQEEGRDYFIGNVVVSKKDDRYILIDGQQRLTTLFLIGVYLASKSFDNWGEFIAKQDKQIRISMPLREDEEKWLLDFIKKTRGKGFGENLIAPNLIHEKILGGLKIIQDWFDQNYKNNPTGERGFSDFLCSDVYFALVELAEGTDLNQFFVRMNNRGKQLEKHEILKARLLKVLQGDGTDVWKKYAKIWDLCSDMDKYIFQSASDRNILNSPNDGIENTNNMSESSLLNILTKENVKNNGVGIYENDGVERAKSIIDFPTFLLHVAKLISKSKNIPINKDKLLENIVVLSNTQSNEKNDKKLVFKDSDNNSVKEFIHNILRYRILFDYFVIKQMVDERLGKQGEYAIKRLYYNQSNKSYIIAEGNAVQNLAKMQNYLRVARAGDKQNYHHWLTPFLASLNKKGFIKKILLENGKIEIEGFLKQDGKLEEWLIQKDKTVIEGNNQKKKKRLVDFLEKLDRDLAYAQIDRDLTSDGTSSDKLISITNQYLRNNKSELSEKKPPCFYQWALANLNQGTETPHYWFYRLEYYLWKGNEMDKQTFDGKKFEEIKQNFRFRGLNSVEHIQPQSKAEGNWQDRRIDCFGNLALISQSFNSSLSNQDTGDKILDLRKKINKDDVESLKLWLAYAKMESQKDNKKEWTYAIAEEHQRKMLEVLKASLENEGKMRGNLSPISK